VIADDYFENHTTPAGTSVNLGSFAAGTEIEFGIYILDTGNTWFDGPGSRNADGAVHAYMQNDYEGQPNLTYVGFEDEPYDPSGAITPYDPTGFNGDFNYLDEVYTFEGARAASAPDITGTLPLLGLGLSSLVAFGRRFRK
jgi:hypothetical protein